MDILIVLFWSLIGSVFSLAGGVLLLGARSLRNKLMILALPFGAGALLAAAFFDLLPESIEGQNPAVILRFALLGFIAFFLIERIAGLFHSHHEHGQNDATKKFRIIVGDTVHNAIDGVAIGAAFLVDVPTGIVTSVAVAAHEIPQEIGDFGLLLARGMKPGRVLLVNALSAIATVVTALSTYLLGSTAALPIAPLLAITAGFFIYIAASDIIPEIHEQPHRRANAQAAMLLVGIIVVASAILLLGV
ncbi:MAG: ZIP family metal transporter [Microcoleus sp.]